MKQLSKITAISAAVAAAFALNVAVAQTPAKKDVPANTAAPAQAEVKKDVPATTAAAAARDPMSYSDRERMKPYNSEKERLEQALKVGQSKANYMKIIADQGFIITSINADKPDYLEYEVVKDGNSYEVQIDLDKKTNMGSKVDVDRNLWRTDATKQALRSGKSVAATTAMKDGGMYSDRAYGKKWTGEKEKLEKAMPPGKDLAFYTGELKKMGYQITSTNDKDKNYVEVEVVKGRDTYEIQIDMDDAGKAKKVDVTTNMWQSEATEKALDSAKK